MAAPRSLAVILILLALRAPGVSAQATPHRASRIVMGTIFDVQIFDADEAAASRAAAAALDEVQRVDRLLSNYSPASELSAMNREAGRSQFRASRELYDFVARCRELFDASAGAFDPTVGPLVRAWGFFSPRPAEPSRDAIAAARARTGFDKVHLDAAAQTVTYAVDGLEFDPGGVGKGYAVDRAVAVLRGLGIESALVSAGGSTLYAIGHPPGREAWSVAVRNPTDADRPFAFVHLRDASLSTSGVSEQSVQAGARRYSHVFDPRTGEPVEGMCQASVIAPTATASDALTKPAFILTRDALVRILGRRRGAHALRVEGVCGTGRTPWTTPWSAAAFAAVP